MQESTGREKTRLIQELSDIRNFYLQRSEARNEMQSDDYTWIVQEAGVINLDGKDRRHTLKAGLSFCSVVTAYNRLTGQRVFAHFYPDAIDIGPDLGRFEFYFPGTIRPTIGAKNEYIDTLLSSIEGKGWDIVVLYDENEELVHATDTSREKTIFGGDLINYLKSKGLFSSKLRAISYDIRNYSSGENDIDVTLKVNGEIEIKSRVKSTSIKTKEEFILKKRKKSRRSEARTNSEVTFVLDFMMQRAKPIYDEILKGGPAKAKQRMSKLSKGDQTPVTIYDPKIEREFHEAKARKFPQDGIFGEELDWTQFAREMWTVDPIDGTVDFVDVGRHFGTLVAKFKDGHPQVAGGYWPRLNLDGKNKSSLITAQVDQPGVLLNGKRIENAQNEKMNQSKIVYLGSHPKAKAKLREKFKEYFHQKNLHCAAWFGVHYN